MLIGGSHCVSGGVIIVRWSLVKDIILLQIMTGIFEKFKEKKLNVLTSLREASDAVYLTVRTSWFTRDRSHDIHSSRFSLK